MQWANAWRWLGTAPDNVYSRRDAAVFQIVDQLLRSYSANWSPSIALTWADILRRMRELGAEKELLACRVQALKFGFAHVRHPLGVVVADSFYDVYEVVTERPAPADQVSSLFSFFDWDRGKELRRALADSFMASQWNPGDLVIAGRDNSLTRKVFKRLMKKYGGPRYAQAALADLQSRSDLREDKAVRNWSRLVSDPDFFEEWD